MPTTGAVFDINKDNSWIVTTVPGLACGFIAIVVMIIFTNSIVAMERGSDKMKALQEMIFKGSNDFLMTEYKFLAVFVLFIFVLVSCLHSHGALPFPCSPHLLSSVPDGSNATPHCQPHHHPL